MPDFRIIGQAPVQGPDIGASYDRGLGNANPSTLGNIFEGVTEGLDFSSKLSARIEQTDALAKETARLNDPERLARQAVKEQLDNQILQQDFLRKGIDNTLDLEFGRTDRALKSRKAELENLYYGDLKDAEIAKDKAYTDYLRQGGARGGSKSDLYTDLDFDRDLTQIRRIEEAQRLLVPPKAMDELELGDTSPTDNVPPEIKEQYDELARRKTMIQSRMKGRMNQSDVYDYEKANKQFATTTADNGLRDGTSRTTSLDQSFQSAEQAIGAMRGTTSTPTEATVSWVSELNAINAQVRGITDPEQKKIAQARLVQQFKDVGPDTIEQTASELKGQDKKNFEQIINAGRALSGNPELLNKDQKRVQEIGLPPKYVESPIKAQQDLNIMLNVGAEFVDDDDFRKALQTDPLVFGAQAALRDAKTFKPVVVPFTSDSTISDITDGTQSSSVIRFLKPDGQYATVPNDKGGRDIIQAPAPAPGDARGQAILSMVQDFSAQQAPQVTAQQQATMQGQQLVQQNQAVQQDVRAANPPPGVTQQQQAPVGAGPAATPTPTPAPQPTTTPIDRLDYTYPPGKHPDLQGTTASFKQETPRGIVIRSPKYNLTYFETDNKPNIDLTPAPGERKTDTLKRIALMESAKKPGMKAVGEEAARLAQAEALLQIAKETEQTISARGEQNLMGSQGFLPKLLADVAEKSYVFGTDEGKEILRNQDSINRAAAEVVNSRLLMGKVATATNSDQEQKTAAERVISQNTQYDNLKLFLETEQARVSKMRLMNDFRANVSKYPELNSPSAVESFLSDYDASPYSKPKIQNPARFKRDRFGKVFEVPGKRGIPMYVQNPEWITPEQYLLLLGNEPQEAPTTEQPTATPTPAPAGQENWAPDSRPTATPTPQPEQRSALEAIGDFFVPNANAEEVDIAPAGGGADFLASAPQVGAFPESVPAPDWTTDLNAGAPLPEQFRTYFEAMGRQFQSPDEVEKFDTLVQQMRDSEGQENAVAWIADTLTFNQLEELMNYFAEAPEGYSKRDMELYNAAREEVIRTTGGKAKAVAEFAVPALFAWQLGGALTAGGQKVVAGTAAARNALAGTRAGKVAATAYNAAKAVPGVSQAMRAAEGAANIGAKYGPTIGTQATLDAGLATLASTPGEWAFGGRPLEEGGKAAAISTAAQIAIPALTKPFIPVLKRLAVASGLRNPRSPDAAAAIMLSEAGINREIIDDFLSKVPPGADPLGYAPPQLQKVLKTFASDPDTSDLLRNPDFLRRKLQEWTGDTLINMRDMGLDNVPDEATLRQDFADQLEATVSPRELEANSVRTGAYSSAESQLRLADATALQLRNQALEESKNGLFRESERLFKDVADNAELDAEAVLNKFDDSLRANFKPEAVARAEFAQGSDLASNLQKEVAATEVVAQNLKKELSEVFKPLERIPIDAAGTKALVRDMVNNYGLGEDIVNQAEKLLTMPTKDLPASGMWELDELRQMINNKLTDKSQPGKKQLKALRDLVVKAGDEALEKAGKGPNYYSQFVANQHEGRKLLTALEGRSKTLRTIEGALTKSKDTGAIRDPIFSVNNRKELVKAFGADRARELDTQLRSLESVKSVFDKVQKGGFPDQAQWVLDEAKAQAQFVKQMGESTAKSIEKLTPELVEAKKLVGAKNLIGGLAKLPGYMADGVAKSLGYTDRTDFSNAALRYLKDNMERSADEIQQGRAISKPGSVRTETQITGLDSKELKNLLTFMTPTQRQAIEAGIARQQAIDQAGFIYDAAPGVAGNVEGIDKAIKKAITWRRTTAAVADVAMGRWFSGASLKEQREFIQKLTDPNPYAVLDFLTEVSGKLKPGRGVYGEYPEFENLRKLMAPSITGYLTTTNSAQTAQDRTAARNDYQNSVSNYSTDLETPTARARDIKKPAPKPAGMTALDAPSLSNFENLKRKRRVQ